MTSCSFTKGRHCAVVFVIFLVTSFSQGVIRAVGIFERELRPDIGLTTCVLGVAAGLAIGLVFFFAPLISVAYRVLANPRQIALIGAVFTACGTIFSSLVLTPMTFCLCFALLGLGNSLVFVSSIIILKGVAKEKFDLMYGISTSGYAFGTIAVPIAAEYLQLIYGWRGAMLILGALTANIIPFVIAIGPEFKAYVEKAERDKYEGEYATDDSESSPDSIYEKSIVESDILLNDQTKCRCMLCFEDEVNRYNEHKSTSNAIPNRQAKGIPNGRSVVKPYSSVKTETVKDDIPSKRDKGSFSYVCLQRLSVIIYNCKSLRQPCLVILTISYFTIGIEVAGWRSIFVPRAIHRGLSLTHVNLMDLTAAFANFISRVALGTNHEEIRKFKHGFLCLVILEGLSKFLDVFIRQFPMMLACSFLSGIALEALAFLPVILGAELLVEQDNFDLLFGLLELLFGAGLLTGGAIAGFIADKMGFNAAYFALAMVNGITFLLVIIFKYFEQKQQKNHPEKPCTRWTN